jgi:hypothetical protein
MSNNDKYPAERAPSPYLNSDILEFAMTIGAFIIGMAGCAWMIAALVA